MATLEDVIIEFKCKNCKRESKMTAFELMQAGTEGYPYCTCSDDDLDVSNCSLKAITPLHTNQKV